MTKSSDIYKLQRPLYTSAGANPNEVYVYNEDESHVGFIPITDMLITMFGEEYKIFIRGEMQDDGQITLLEQVKDPGW